MTQPISLIFTAILLLKIPFSAAFQTRNHRIVAPTLLRFNGLEFDDTEMNDFVDQRTVKMDSIGIDDDFVREEYEKWLHLHQKEECEVRYKQFKKNFLLQLEYDSEEGGRFHDLNEFGDLSSGKEIELCPYSITRAALLHLSQHVVDSFVVHSSLDEFYERLHQ